MKNNQRGVSMVEYGLLLALILAGLIVYYDIFLDASKESHDVNKEILHYRELEPLGTYTAVPPTPTSP